MTVVATFLVVGNVSVASIKTAAGDDHDASNARPGLPLFHNFEPPFLGEGASHEDTFSREMWLQHWNKYMKP